MITRPIADHEGEMVIIRDEDKHKIAGMSAEDAIKLAHDLLNQADKVLAHQSNNDD